MSDAKRVKSLGTKVTQAEYDRLQALAGTVPMSEWVRVVLLAQLTRVPVEEAMMAEMLVVRGAVLTTLGQVAPTLNVKSIAERLDADKYERATKRLSGQR